MTKSIIIGCPVYKREWILPKWFECIEKQNYPLDKVGFIFELGPDDEATHEALWSWQMNHPEIAIFDGQIREDLHHQHHPDGSRFWSGERYYTMVELRNSLLERVAAFDPDFYFSLDSDILLENPNTLTFISEYIDDYNVISPLTFMTPYDTEYPSVMWWKEYAGGHATRANFQLKLNTFFEADIVMAAVAMSRSVYRNVRYRWHKQGEDLGFAAELHRLGFSSFCASNIYCPHIMNTKMLDQYIRLGHDPRIIMSVT